MTGRQMAGIVVIIGIGLLAVSLLADIIGIGNDLGFGVRQTMGSIAGVVIVFLGLMVMRKAA